MPTQLFGDRLHLACRHALYIHLQHRRHERFLTPLVPLEDFCAEASLPVLRHPQLDMPDPRHQPPAVITGAVPEPARCALALARLQRFVHLRFQHLL